MLLVGQWAPIAGTTLAALGSLYLLFASDSDPDLKENASKHHCNCPNNDDSPSSPKPRSSIEQGMATELELVISTPRTSLGVVVSTPSQAPLDANHQKTVDAGSRRKVAHTLTAIGNYLGTVAHDQYESEFKRGKALDWPEIPGEVNRNKALLQIREQYNQAREDDEDMTPAPHRQSSRAGSFVESINSNLGEGNSTTPRSHSPGGLLHASTLPAGKNSFEKHHSSASNSAANATLSRPRKRRETLDVPGSSPFYHSAGRENSGTSGNSSPVSPSILPPIVTTAPGDGPSSPTIVVSSDVDNYTPTSRPPSPFPPANPLATPSGERPSP